MAAQQTYLSRGQSPTVRFPWRSYNQVELLPDAESFYPAMLNAISTAEQTILLEMYLIESGSITSDFIAAFILAAKRDVSIYLLFDAFGSHNLNHHDRALLQHENIHLTFFNPLYLGRIRRNFFRDHRKILIIDLKIVFVGGAGIADSFITRSETKLGWRDTMIQLRGECLADWVYIFENVWKNYSPIPICKCNSEIVIDSEMNHTCRVVYALGIQQKIVESIKRSLVIKVRGAKDRIWISTAYFLPSYNVRRALKSAARRGIDVRLLLPGNKTDHPAIRYAGRRYYYRLLKAGVKIYEYQPRFLHQKILLCDQWVSIGSSNIDRWNIRWNLEANQEVDNADFVSHVTQMLEKDFGQSYLFDLNNWEQRPWYFRIQEWFWGIFDTLLDKYIR